MIGLVPAFLDVLWPPRCALCGGDELEGPCAEHRLPARPPPPRCGRCAAPLAPMIPDGARCPRCRGGGLGVRRVVALADYGDGAARTWVLRLKHGGRGDLARPLGRELARRLAEEAREPDWSRCLVPVPLHPLRRFERGSDQAELLARAVAEAGGGRRVRALRRVRATLPQGAAAAGVSRAANVAGAFRLRRRAAARVRGAACWLVDDVVTSGATAAACARELRRGGARWVGVLCVARAAGLTDRPATVDPPGP